MEADAAVQDEHNRRITELICDEEKIVTSASLAGDLKISRKDAQNLLNNFVKDHRNKKLNVYATYLLYGLLKDKKDVGVYLVKEEDLNEKKSLFDKIATEVIYSIQNSKRVEYQMVALANSVQENGSCLLKSRNCIKRNFKTKKLLVAQAAASAAKCNETSLKKCPTGNENLNDVQDKPKPSSQKQPMGKLGGITSFFSKATTKTQSSVKVENTKNEQSKKSKPEVDLALCNASPKEVLEKPITKDERMDANSDIEKSTVQQTQNSNKKRKKANKDKGPNKKRKRIQEICYSDSDDIFDDGENSDIIEMSDEEAVVQVPVVNPPPIPKNKKRKAVDKTYVDEEGFIVTTTEYIYETASEDEQEQPKPKPEINVSSEKKKENSAKISPDPSKPSKGKGKNKKVTNGKQPTLMSFFKKN